MSLTIGNWIFIAIVFILGLTIAGVALHAEELGTALGLSIGTLFLCITLGFGLNWYHTNTAVGARGYKDYESNMNNGIHRSITIMEKGAVIYEHEGTFDIEIHSDYIVFDENGVRYIVYKSYISTIIIKEKE